MSLFSKHIAASQSGGRIAVSLRAEEGAEAETGTGTDVTDDLAAQRERLNQRHEMIRNRGLSSEGDAAAVVAEEIVAEEIVAEEEALPEEVPAEEVPVEGGEEAPAGDVVEDVVEGEPEVEIALAAEGGEEEVIDADAPLEEVPGEEAPAADGEGEPVVDEETLTVVAEDEEVEDEVADVDGDDVFEMIDSDTNQIEALETEMSMLGETMVAVESFGINPTAFSIMQTTGLLAGTALADLGLEAFGYSDGNHPESKMALEALDDKYKEKQASWSAKVLGFAKNVGEKVVGVLKTVWDKVSGAVKFLGSASWEGLKTAGNTVKAHPYKTIIGVVAAIAVVAGIVTYGGTNLPLVSKSGEVMTSFITKIKGMVTGIKWPFGKIATGDKGQLLLEYTGSNIRNLDAGTPAKLGWTQSSVKAISSQLTRAYNATVTGATTLLTHRVTKVAAGMAVGGAYAGGGIRAGADGNTKFVEAGSKLNKGQVGGAIKGAGGAYVAGFTGFFKGFWAVIKFYGKLIKLVVVDGLKLIFSTFAKLVSAVKGSKPAAA